ncbi:hypothetical protein N7494_009431 [Penicillium frequentans]|uniref:Uncharacterized protein n=1 Tax=Penicillium frequentans TaxID=3151616 RepID=A0AAD6GDD9_9EURO|nr:hypothetical protein N7494_009431 [Penicillium glabrum]
MSTSNTTFKSGKSRVAMVTLSTFRRRIFPENLFCWPYKITAEYCLSTDRQALSLQSYLFMGKASTIDLSTIDLSTVDLSTVDLKPLD